MHCKNYYKMPEEEIIRWIDIIKNWMFDNPDHPQFAKAEFALDVCLCAVQLTDSLENDQFLKDLIDFIT
jgi:hypothetical protein